MADSHSEEPSAFMHRVDAAIMDRLVGSVVPICAEQNGAPVQCGTGTLFRVADKSFLITASHVADIKSKHNIDLYTVDRPWGSPAIVIQGRAHADQRRDIAIVELHDSVVKSLPNRRFLTVHDADFRSHAMADGLYYIHGFPNEWSEPHIRDDSHGLTVKALTYSTTLFLGDTTRLAGYDASIHLLLDVKKVGNIDLNGIPHNVPSSLGGISGSSLWLAYEEAIPKNWSIDDFVVVAVQTGVYNDGKIVKGTRWHVVFEALRAAYPELETALSLINPRKLRRS